MTENTANITADNMRADYINATTNWQRWKILNRALDWAVTASENAEAARGALQRRVEPHDYDWSVVDESRMP